MWFWAAPKLSPGKRCYARISGSGYGLNREWGAVQHTLLFDTGPEGAIFLRNCANLGLNSTEVEALADTFGEAGRHRVLARTHPDAGSRVVSP
jgi:hypothetical protein